MILTDLYYKCVANAVKNYALGEFALSQFHLADLFETVVARVPNRLALVDDKGEITYEQMNKRSSRLAAGLYNQGVRRGDHVGLYLMNGPEYLESFFAIMKLGAVPFNVNYRYQFEELKYLFDNADAKAVIHGAEFSPMVERLKGALPKLVLSFAVGRGEYAALMECDPNDAVFERSEDDYLLQYTGGTTGMPKGVMWPHKAFFFSCLGGGGMYVRKDPIEEPEQQADYAEAMFPIRILPVAPLMHGAAIWAALSGLLGGITMVLDPMRGGFDAENIWDRVEQKQVNALQIVGDAMAVPLLEALKAYPDRWDLSRLINLGSGGAVFSGHIKDEFRAILPNAIITDGMGTSESGYSGMAEVPKDGGFMRLKADDVQNIIVDDRLAEPGETGLLGRAGHIAAGYYNDPEKTAEVFREVGGKRWALSGDQGRLDADGMITVFGRGSTCINTGGEKVYPEEVEEVLRAHPAIHDAAVVGIPDPKWGQQLNAVISLSDGHDVPSLGAVKDYCRIKLAGYKIPKAVEIVPEIKRSPAGKQDYRWAKSIFEYLLEKDN